MKNIQQKEIKLRLQGDYLHWSKSRQKTACKFKSKNVSYGKYKTEIDSNWRPIGDH